MLGLFIILEKWPSIALVEIITHWMEEAKDELKKISGSTLLLGLSRWTILYPLIVGKINKNKSVIQDDHNAATYAQLHLSILETLADSKKDYSITSKSIGNLNKMCFFLIQLTGSAVVIF